MFVGIIAVFIVATVVIKKLLERNEARHMEHVEPSESAERSEAP